MCRDRQRRQGKHVTNTLVFAMPSAVPALPGAGDGIRRYRGDAVPGEMADAGQPSTTINQRPPFLDPILGDWRPSSPRRGQGTKAMALAMVQKRRNSRRALAVGPSGPLHTAMIMAPHCSAPCVVTTAMRRG